MTITHHPEVVQGSDEWAAMRCGLLTASEIKKIITPTLKIASNADERAHLYELAAQRITKYVEPQYVSDDMLRGKDDEILARALYSERYAPVTEVGFITNDCWGFTLGYSPDGLVDGDDGLIECKSRRQKFQIEAITSGEVPTENVLQLQAGLLISERQWIDYISYSGGLPMVTIRVFPDAKIQAAILEAAEGFEARLAVRLAKYREVIGSDARLIATERKVEQEMFV